MEEKIYKLNLNTYEKTYIFDDCIFYKTDALLNDMRNILRVDFLLTKLAESIKNNFKEINKLQGHGDSFLIQIEDNNLYFKFIGKDIVFYKFLSPQKPHKNDRRFLNIIMSSFAFSVSKSRDAISTFKRLYTLTGESGISFPILDPSQKQIVNIEDGNVLVQGVAGSGKTNICIDKILYTASRGYKGRTLYSTFSRGLLIDTKNKVLVFCNRIKEFIETYKLGNLVISGNANKAVNNKLCSSLKETTIEKIIVELENILKYLEENVDYYLISDLYEKHIGEKYKLADEEYFIKEYLPNIKNHHLTNNLSKISNLDYEIIYKEIYGMILGSNDLLDNVDDYVEKRKNSFSKQEAETIYNLALDYKKTMQENGYKDNNTLSKEISNLSAIYSLTILDEVQDFTEANLTLFKNISLKLFCVGDALQMINPSYFSFAALKRLLYAKDITTVKELKYNYRNTAKLNDIIDNLNAINIDQFGTHNFILSGEPIENGETTAIYSNGDLLNQLNQIDLSNCTIVTGGVKSKEQLRSLLKKPEILTVAEIKGLERDTILLVNILSDNKEKLDRLYRDKINHKTADENSVYRYYLNLFYVGISRSKHNLFVCENKEIKLFNEFLNNNFEKPSIKSTLSTLSSLIGEGGLDEDELYSRIDEFLNLGQYDNARFTAKNLSSEQATNIQLTRIDIYATMIKNGDYKNAGIALWENGLDEEAKKYFDLSNNHNLSELVDACKGSENGKLDASIALFYPELKDNEIASTLIIDTLNKDLESLREKQKQLNKDIKSLKTKIKR